MLRPPAAAARKGVDQNRPACRRRGRRWWARRRTSRRQVSSWQQQLEQSRLRSVWNRGTRVAVTLFFPLHFVGSGAGAWFLPFYESQNSKLLGQLFLNVYDLKLFPANSPAVHGANAFSVTRIFFWEVTCTLPAVIVVLGQVYFLS